MQDPACVGGPPGTPPAASLRVPHRGRRERAGGLRDEKNTSHDEGTSVVLLLRRLCWFCLVSRVTRAGRSARWRRSRRTPRTPRPAGGFDHPSEVHDNKTTLTTKGDLVGSPWLIPQARSRPVARGRGSTLVPPLSCPVGRRQRPQRRGLALDRWFMATGEHGGRVLAARLLGRSGSRAERLGAEGPVARPCRRRRSSGGHRGRYGVPITTGPESAGPARCWRREQHELPEQHQHDRQELHGRIHHCANDLHGT